MPRMDHRSQLLKGVLDMCLLAIINEEPSYGYEMADKLSQRGLHLSSEGSIYPTLSRMQRSSLIEGYFARLMYLSLYKMHEYALHGFAKVFLDTLARLITRRTEPHVKLH